MSAAWPPSVVVEPPRASCPAELASEIREDVAPGTAKANTLSRSVTSAETAHAPKKIIRAMVMASTRRNEMGRGIAVHMGMSLILLLRMLKLKRQMKSYSLT